MMNETIHRIQRMEACHDTLHDALMTDPARIFTDPALMGMLEALEQYYVNGQWLQDFRLDEQGGLPHTLKRGVLSEDAVYDLLREIGELQKGL